LEAEGYAVSDVMLQYVKQMAFPSVPIVGCSRVEQVVEAMTGIEKQIPASVMDTVLKIKEQHRIN
jgi:aryl-alcohol dehydrogenase-like predicted oxidoreductase